MKLEKILKEVFNIQGSNLGNDFRLSSIEEWDSMTHMLLITRLEEDFEVVLTGDEIASMDTVGEIKRILAEKGKPI